MHGAYNRHGETLNQFKIPYDKCRTEWLIRLLKEAEEVEYTYAERRLNKALAEDYGFPFSNAPIRSYSAIACKEKLDSVKRVIQKLLEELYSRKDYEGNQLRDIE